MIKDNLQFLFNMLTSSSDEARIKVDNHRTAYDENREFYLFHRFLSVGTNDQIVLKFTLGNAINLIERGLSPWAGDREYLVIPASQVDSETVDQQLTGTISPIPVNNNLSKGLDQHPTSGATIVFGVGSGIIDVSEIDVISDGDVFVTGTTGSKVAAGGTADDALKGYEAGTEVYVVIENIGSGVSSFQYKLTWEELT